LLYLPSNTTTFYACQKGDAILPEVYELFVSDGGVVDPLDSAVGYTCNVVDIRIE